MPQVKINREEIDKLIAEFFKSNISQNEFCRQKNLNVGTFRWWLKRQRDLSAKKRGKAEVPFVKVVPKIPEMKNPCRESELVIEFESGSRLKWRGFEIPQAFHQLVSTLTKGAV
jgi:hypothetical protein